METGIDFVQLLEVDMVLMILGFLDDPSDLIRASTVSRFWKHFMISNKISKKLCLRLFPQMAFLSDFRCTTSNSADLESCNVAEYKSYALLARTFTTSTSGECVAEAISASSTDYYPRESIRNTLYSGDIFRFKLYWSSKGSENPEEPETLIYKLLANFCVITEIKINPFHDDHYPYIYSAKAVRFRMGHPRSPSGIECNPRNLPLQIPADDKFIWTYTSPVFPMKQENWLQKFKLPEPVFCIGGFIQIELLGRVQKHEVDNLYYLCVSRVNVIGESLFPKFDIEILDHSGKFLLKYSPENEDEPMPVSSYNIIENWIGGLPEFDHIDDDDDNDNNSTFSCKIRYLLFCDCISRVQFSNWCYIKLPRASYIILCKTICDIVSINVCCATWLTLINLMANLWSYNSRCMT